MWEESRLLPTPAVLPNFSEELGNNESAIRVLTDNSRLPEIIEDLCLYPLN